MLWVDRLADVVEDIVLRGVYAGHEADLYGLHTSLGNLIDVFASRAEHGHGSKEVDRLLGLAQVLFSTFFFPRSISFEMVPHLVVDARL